MKFSAEPALSQFNWSADIVCFTGISKVFPLRFEMRSLTPAFSLPFNKSATPTVSTVSLESIRE